jgi:hypothetical protein
VAQQPAKPVTFDAVPAIAFDDVVPLVAPSKAIEPPRPPAANGMPAPLLTAKPASPPAAMPMGMKKTSEAITPTPPSYDDDEMPTPPDDDGDLWGEGDEAGYLTAAMPTSTATMAPPSLQSRDATTRGDANDPQAWEESVGFAKQLLHGKVLE